MISKLKPKSNYFKNILVLLTGTTLSQSIPVIASPILTRLYSPEDFGVFALFLSLTSLFAVIATGKYDLAIIIPRKDIEAKYLIILSLIISFFVILLVLVLVFTQYDLIKSLFPKVTVYDWLYILPISILLMSFK